jgi:RimJ/RimL family protein N-acetyltransferase
MDMQSHWRSISFHYPVHNPPMSIAIRKLTPEDCAAYRSCRLDALRDSPNSFASSYEEEAQMSDEAIRARFAAHPPESAVFGAFDGERIIGLTGIFREERKKRSHKMYIVSVFVQPEYRGQKIGSRLVETAIAHARDVDGVERIDLALESTNAAAKSLYASFGFQSWGTEPSFAKVDGIDYDEEHMSLKL